jgi:hypothetical protein
MSRAERICANTLAVFAVVLLSSASLNEYRTGYDQCGVASSKLRDDWQTHSRDGFSFRTPFGYGWVTGPVTGWPEVLKNPSTNAYVIVDVGAAAPIIPARFSLHVDHECKHALGRRPIVFMLGRVFTDSDTLLTAQIFVPEYQPGVALRIAGFAPDSARFREVREIVGSLSVGNGNR